MKRMRLPILISLVVSVWFSGCTSETKVSQELQLFNHGRTRCFGGGLAFSQDGKTLFHPITVKIDSAQFPYIRLAWSQWSDTGWSEPTLIQLTQSLDLFPVLSSDEQRIYFTSTAPPPGSTGDGDLNIWYAQKEGKQWSTAFFVDSLNSENNERMVCRDEEGNYYVASDKEGNLDLYKTRFENNNWLPLQPVQEWNSDLNDEFVTVNLKLGIAIIQRTQPGSTTEMLISTLNDGVWSSPVGLKYNFKSTVLPYVQRWPTLSPDGSTFYLVSHALIWQQSMAELLKDNDISLPVEAPPYNPLAVPSLQFGEPELFGGLQLKTNNGIALAPGEKSIYVSRYTQERDSTGSSFIKIFRCDLDSGKWSDPQLVSVCKPNVPFEYHPVLSPGGSRLFFNSRAHLPESNKPYESKNNLWYSDKQSDGSWGDPVLIKSLVTDFYDDYASATNSGSLYFRSDRPGGVGEGDIYVSRWENGEYQAPENVSALNSIANENDVCVDPDERFIIFNRYFDSTKEIKFYISLRSGSGWMPPRLLRQIEKDVDWELTPALSPDATYFYYEVNSNIFRVETKSLFTEDELKILESNS